MSTTTFEEGYCPQCGKEFDSSDYNHRNDGTLIIDVTCEHCDWTGCIDQRTDNWYEGEDNEQKIKFNAKKRSVKP